MPNSLLLRTTALAAVLLAPAVAAANPLHVQGKPKVEFLAQGNPGALDIDGVANEVAIADDGTSLVFTVPMDKVSTGIDLRDEHMKSKFLEVEKFPNVTLAVPRASLTFPTDVNAATNGKVTVPFTAHGVTHDVELTYEIRKTKTGWRLRGEFPFDVTLYGIAIPSYLGVTVEKDMHAQAQIDVTDAP